MDFFNEDLFFSEKKGLQIMAKMLIALELDF